MVKKKLLWRKSVDDSKLRKLERKEAQPQKEKFFLDTSGSEKLNNLPYPKKFAKDKTRSISKQDKLHLDKLKPKVLPKPELEEYDIWREEGETKDLKWPEEHIPAVIPAMSGQSYQPTELEHTIIIEKIVNEEEEKQKQIEYYKNILENYTMNEEPELMEAEDNETHEFKKNPAVKEIFLTNSQRNSKHRKLIRKKLLKEQEAKKSLNEQFDSLKALVEQVDEELARQGEKRERKEEITKQRKELEKRGEAVPKVIQGKFQLEQPETVGVGKIPESLRQVKVKANSMDERFKSYVSRKMVDLDPGSLKRRKITIKERICGENETERLHKKRQKQASLKFSK